MSQGDRVLLALSVLAVLALLGVRAAAGPGPTPGQKIASSVLPVCVPVAGVFMLFLLALCTIPDTCSPEQCDKCQVRTHAANPIFWSYLSVVGLMWFASVVDGFRGKRTRQARLLKLARRIALAVPVLVFVADVLYGLL